VIYILLFDREIVEKALDGVSNDKGREYLEKIIQTSFIVPKIDDENLDDLLKTELKEILEQYIEDDCDKHRFRNVYYSGYRDFFKSVRDIRRYKNSLKCNISLVYKDVNIIDFLIIEAFRIYIPEVYTLIAENKEFFANTTTSLGTELEHWKQKLSTIFNKIGNENEAISKPLLAYLFPQKYELFEEKYPTGPLNEIECQKERRICSKVFFDIYFISGVPKSILSESEFGNLIEKFKQIEKKIGICKDKNFNTPEDIRSYYSQKTLEQDDYALDLILNKLRDRKYATQFLRKLRVRNIEFSTDFIKEFCIVLFDICDCNNRGTEKINVYEIYMVIEKYFKSMEYSDKKAIFEDIIRSSHGILTISSIIQLNLEFYEPDSTLKPVFLQKDTDYFKKLWIDKIESFAICGELKGHSGVPYLLSTYKTWGDEEKAKRYFDELIATPDGLLEFLKKLTYETYTHISGDKVSKCIQKVDYSIIIEFLPLDEIEKRINSLDNLSYNDSKFTDFGIKCLNEYKSRKTYASEE
jgi:tetratricopeptide (TPR) repeat protein